MRPERCREKVGTKSYHANGGQHGTSATLPHFQVLVGMGERDGMKSPIIKRSVVLSGRKTSITVEDAFWVGFKSIATERKIGVGTLLSQIDAERRDGNLSSAVRLFVLATYRSEAAGTGSQHQSRSVQPART